MVVTRLKIEEVIASGARTVDEIGARCAAGTDCGKCRTAIMRLLVAADTGVSTNPADNNVPPPR